MPLHVLSSSREAVGAKSSLLMDLMPEDREPSARFLWGRAPGRWSPPDRLRACNRSTLGIARVCPALPGLWLRPPAGGTGTDKAAAPRPPEDVATGA